MNSTRSIHLRLSAVFCLGILLAAPSTAQTDRHVDASQGSDSGNNCTNSAAPCATVGHALGQSAAGDRILAAAGIYTESLLIDRNIEIVGEASDTTIIQAAATPNTASQRVITVQSQRNLALRHLTIRHGYANATLTPNSLGGGIYLEGGDLELEYVVLTGNRSNSDGGAIYNAAGSVDMRHADLDANLAKRLGGARNRGGAIYNSSGATLTALNSRLRGNDAAQGGAIYSDGAVVKNLTNVALSGNFALEFGGAMMYGSGQQVMTNLVFSGNRTDGLGGGIYALGSSTKQLIRNSVFWNNQDQSGVGTRTASLVADALNRPTSFNSLVQGCGASGSGWDNRCGTDGGNNLPAQNPNFIDPVNPASAPTSQGYFRQNTGSPLIDQGNNSYITGVTTDLDGLARIIDGVVDLGPYEFGNDVLFRDRFEQ